MDLNAQGRLKTQPNETITVTVKKTVGALNAAFSELHHTDQQWTSISSPNAATQVRTFKAPSASQVFFFVIVFNFVPDATGAFAANDQYEVTISGSASGGFQDVPIGPDPPVTSRTYEFVC